MYKIRDGNGSEFGPVIAEVVHQWIARGKAGPETLVLKMGESDWRPVSQFPEFSAAPSSNASPEGSRRRRGGRARAGDSTSGPRTTGWAMASLAGGLLGLLILPGIIGIVSGMVAHIRIENDPSRFKGARLALIGMVLSGLTMLVGLPLWGGLYLPNWVRDSKRAQEQQCTERALELVRHLKSYALAHDGQLPRADAWCDALHLATATPAGRGAFVCPARPSLVSGYAFNALLSATNSAALDPDVVLVFESDLGWNGAGGPYDVAASRHGAFVIVGFNGGTVERVPGWRLPQLRWIP